MKPTRKLVWLLIVAACLASAFGPLGPIAPAAAYTQSYTHTYEAAPSDGYIYDDDAGSYLFAWNRATGTVADGVNTMALGQQVPGGLFTIFRSYLFFNTSNLPSDVNVTGAILSIYVSTDASTTDFNITLQNGQPTYPRDPLQTGDYDKDFYSGNGGNRSTSEIAGVGYFNITLNDTGFTWIQNASTTKLCLRSDRDINATEPTGNERITFYAAEYGTSYSAKLYVTYSTDSAYLYRLYGSYYEDGTSAGAVNITFYRPTQSNIDFELNGEYNVTSDADTRMVFHIELGYNDSRVFFVGDQTYMDIYVFQPDDPYYFYYFDVVDLVGITNGYLETLVVIDGIDRIVERQRLDILNDVPFTLSWGRAYKVRLVCDQGSYSFGRYVAGATSEFTLVVTQDMFPVDPTHLGEITLWSRRSSGSTILLNYSDSRSETSWINFTIYDSSDDSLAWSSNQTVAAYNFSWTSAVAATEYYGIVLVSHSVRGSLSWRISYPVIPTSVNPWDFSWLDPSGTFPFPTSQAFAFFLVALVFAAGHKANAAITIVIGLLMTAFFVWFSWLTMDVSWLAISFGVGLLAAISIVRERKEKGAMAT